MENIEEHCEDNASDNEATPLIKTPKSASPLVNSFTASPCARAVSEQEMTPGNTTSNVTGCSRDSQQTSFEKFSTSFGKGNRKLNSTDAPKRVGGSDVSTASSSNSSSSTSTPPRMAHLHKLEKKHSSGDLHSRLKTRKLLGVGETDDGDIHRSKLSQILGHSDQLYIRLPYGLRIWQLLIAIMFTFYGLWALVLPSHILNTTLEVSGADDVILPVRLYGCALVSLSIVYWMTLSTQDRDIIRMCLMTSIVYFGVQFIVSVLSPVSLAAPLHSCLGPYAHLLWRAGQVVGSLYFYVALTRDMRHYR